MTIERAELPAAAAGGASRPTILTVADYYLPGWKAGGLIRAVENLVEALGDRFRFDIVTRDRDLGDTQPYPGITRGEWCERGSARVLHLAPRDASLRGLRRLLRGHGWCLLYLNSFFSRLTLRVLLLRRLGLLPPVPVLLAPRGELHAGALSLRPRRKQAWIRLSRWLGLYRGIAWQAATSGERDDIVRACLVRAAAARRTISVVPDIFRPNQPGQDDGAGDRTKRSGHARVVFISRIARNKNLDYALRVLSQVPGHIEFDIFGPVEDAAHWRECQELMAKLPASVDAHYRGTLANADVPSVFARYDVFFFPTRGESFGHAILESFLAGCPVLTSGQVPWRELQAHGAGWNVPLGEPLRFVETLTQIVGMTEATLAPWRHGAREFGSTRAGQSTALDTARLLANVACLAAPSAPNEEIPRQPAASGSS